MKTEYLSCYNNFRCMMITVVTEDGAVVEKNEKQIVLMQMYYAFEYIKNANQSMNDLYRMVLTQKSEKNMSHTYLTYMYGERAIEDKIVNKYMTSFGFNEDTLRIDGIFDYKFDDEEYNLGIEEMKALVEIEDRIVEITDTRNRAYHPKDAKIRAEIMARIARYTNKVMQLFDVKNKRSRNKLEKTNMGKFLINIGAVARVQKEITDKVFESADNFINIFNDYQTYLANSVGDKVFMGKVENTKKRLNEIEKKLESLQKYNDMKKNDFGYDY